MGLVCVSRSILNALLCVLANGVNNMAEPFNDERIEHLTTSHNWELAYFDDGRRVTHNALIPWLLPHTETTKKKHDQTFLKATRGKSPL